MGGGGPLLATDLWPLAVGNSWTYSPDSKCAMPDVFQVAELAPYQGRMAYRFTDTCSPDGFWLSVVDGNIQQFAEAWHSNLAVPIEDGATWAWNDTYDFVWKSEPTVTVQMGTFHDCWRRVDPDNEAALSRVYCPGIGSVLSESPTEHYELTAYHVGP